MIITKKKNPFEKFDTEIKMPAVLNLQIWDNDTFSPDDFLGAVTINLSHFPSLSSTPEKCTTSRKISYYENLFAIDGSIKGWCCVHGRDDEKGPIKITVNFFFLNYLSRVMNIFFKGKIEIELEVLNEEKSRLSPAGLGREGPQKLPRPK